MSRIWAIVGIVVVIIVVVVGVLVLRQSPSPTPGTVSATPGAEKSGAGKTGAKAIVALKPAQANVATGDTLQMAIEIGGVADFYGAEVHLTYEPTMLEVQDANGQTEGVQIKEGTFPDPSAGKGFVAANLADSSKGTIDYVVTLLNPSPPLEGGGTLATVTFKATKAGTAQVKLAGAILASRAAIEIPSTTQDGVVTIR